MGRLDLVLRGWRLQIPDSEEIGAGGFPIASLMLNTAPHPRGPELPGAPKAMLATPPPPRLAR